MSTKYLLPIIVCISSTQGFAVWPFNSPKPSSVDVPTVHALFNDLINDAENIKKQNVELQQKIQILEKQQGISSFEKNEIVSQGEIDKVIESLKSIDELNLGVVDPTETEDNQTAVWQKKAEELEKKVEELEEQRDHYKASLINTYKTFGANMKASSFSQLLDKNIKKLEDTSITRILNEEIANSIYRLKFMYLEILYNLEYLNKKVNWKSDVAKKFTPPNITKDKSHKEIQDAVMSLLVK